MPGIEGMIDTDTGVFEATAQQLDANLGGDAGVSLKAQQIDIDWDPDETDTSVAVVTVMAATLTIGQVKDEEGAPLTLEIGDANDPSSPPGLIVTREGFTISDASLLLDFSIDGVLEVDGLLVEAENISYTSGGGGGVTGLIEFSANNLTLFPGSGIFTSGVSNLEGAIDLGVGGSSLVLTAEDFFVEFFDMLRPRCAIDLPDAWGRRDRIHPRTDGHVAAARQRARRHGDESGNSPGWFRVRQPDD